MSASAREELRLVTAIGHEFTILETLSGAVLLTLSGFVVGQKGAR